VALLVWVAALRSACLAADRLPDREVPFALDFARLSHAAYFLDYTPIPSTRGGTWRRIDFGSTASGLNWMLFARADGGGRTEYFLSYTGTQLRSWAGGVDAFDLLADYQQATSATRLQTPQQYRDALSVADAALRRAGQDGAWLTVGGHSLGGALAQYVSFHRGVRAFVYNSAGLSRGSLDTGLLHSTSAERRSLASSNVVNVSLRQDPVSHLLGRVGDVVWTQLGRRYELELPAAVAPGPLNVAAHDQRHVIGALERDYGAAPVPLAPDASPGDLRERMSTLGGRLSDGVTLIDGAVAALRRHHLGDERVWRVITPPDGSPGARTKDLLLDGLTIVEGVHDVLRAVEHDLAAARDGSFVPVRSETIEACTAFGLALSSRPTFGLDALGFAAARTVATRQMTVDDVELFADAAVGLSWGLLGLAWSRGDAKVAGAFEDVGRASARLGRDVTFKWFVRLANPRLGRDVEDMWRALQRRAVASGLPVQSIEQVFGREFLIAEAGFDERALARLAREADHLRGKSHATFASAPRSGAADDARRRALGRTGMEPLAPDTRRAFVPPPPCPPSQCGGGAPVGGVKIAGPVERKVGPLPGAHDVLEGRPHEAGQLTWPVGR
jgi:hypothetical protein